MVPRDHALSVSTGQCSTVQYITIQFCMVQDSTVHSCKLQYITSLLGGLNGDN